MAVNIETLRKESDNTEVYPNIVTGCIPEGGVTESKIQDEAVTENKIKNGAVTPEKISGKFETDRIEDGAITTIKIQNQAITTDKIHNRAVTSAKLGDSSVETQKIQNDAVITAKIAAGAVVEEKIGSDAVTTSKIKNGAVTAAKIADGTITVSKISNITQGNTIATQEYVDEHGGGGGSTLYKHHIKITMLDQCGEINYYGIIILENNQEQSYTFDTFKNLFTMPMDPFQVYTEYGMCFINVPASQYFGDEYQYAPKVTYFYYSPEKDFYDCDDSYSGHLTLQNVVDTVTPV